MCFRDSKEARVTEERERQGGELLLKVRDDGLESSFIVCVKPRGRTGTKRINSEQLLIKPCLHQA